MNYLLIFLAKHYSSCAESFSRSSTSKFIKKTTLLKMKKLTLFLLLFSFVQTSYAYKAHVSDELQVNLRTGPSLKYRVSGTLTSGEPFTVINDQRSKKFLQIKTLDGKVAWIAKSKIKVGTSLKEKGLALEKSLANSVLLIKKQADEIHRLKNLLNTQKIENERHSTNETQLNSKINTLSNEIDKLDDSNLIRWFTHASIVSLFGIFLLFIASIIKKRRRYDSFS